MYMKYEYKTKSTISKVFEYTNILQVLVQTCKVAETQIYNQLEGHSVECMHLRQSCSDGSR